MWNPQFAGLGVDAVLEGLVPVFMDIGTGNNFFNKSVMCSWCVSITNLLIYLEIGSLPGMVREYPDRCLSAMS
jgi:hypothetical protein